MLQSIKLDDRLLVTDFSIGVQVGDVLQLDTITQTFSYLTNIGEEIANLQDHITSNPSASNNIVSSDSSSLAITFNASANLPNVAQGDLELNFSSSNSTFIALKNVVYKELAIEDILDPLNAYWSRHNFTNGILVRHHTLLVTAVLHADSGTYLYNLAKNNQVVIKGNGNVPVPDASLVLTGNISIGYQKNTVQSIISTTPIQPLFTVQHNLLIGGWRVFA